uniref:Ig-like domain-containing protein n=1 Tax=Scophthalmus maximus TaxID=52904 RepID=A0A8D3AW44_SCOMX
VSCVFVFQLLCLIAPSLLMALLLMNMQNLSQNLVFREKWYYWYKQTPWQNLRLISTFYKYNTNGTFHDEFMNDPHVRRSDAATYYCVNGFSTTFRFMEGITVSVEGSGLNIQARVHQSASETVQPGGSVTLSCTVQNGTCDGEHSVYWFKNFEESHPELIYTHGDRDDQCERKPNTQTHSCVYQNAAVKSLNLSHAGTDYCAVTSCGHVLFGNGTKLDIEGESLGFLSFKNVKLYNLYYNVPVSEKKLNGPRRRWDNTWTECVYLSVKQ